MLKTRPGCFQFPNSFGASALATEQILIIEVLKQRRGFKCNRAARLLESHERASDPAEVIEHLGSRQDRKAERVQGPGPNLVTSRYLQVAQVLHQTRRGDA